METIIHAIDNKQNVILTSLGGVERSRFLLRIALESLSKTDRQVSFRRIIHIVSWDENVTKTFNEAQLFPFTDLNFNIAKLYGTETETNKSDSIDVIQSAQYIVCTMKFVLDIEAAKQRNLPRENSVIVFDGVPLDNIEGTCCELSESMTTSNPDFINSPEHIFGQLSRDSWSIILACNRPTDGLEAELGCSFQIVIDQDLHPMKKSYRVFSSILTEGPRKMPMLFGPEKFDDLNDDVGRVIEECSKRIDSGGIVVFLPSYGEMIAYHNSWQKSGLFERIGLPFARENRGEGKLKSMLVNFSSHNKKSIVLISHRFHQNVHFADYVLSSSARVVISVGLPYPFTNETWTARTKRNDEVCLRDTRRLNGGNLYKYRAIEFMNGVVRKCLDEFRYQDCAFFILDKAMSNERNKLTQEMGDVQVESFGDCMKRFDAFCRI